MLASDFDFDLPPELIAQEPPAAREDARLMLVDRATGTLRHDQIGALRSELRPGDLLVVNDTRVLPARVNAVRATGGRVEVLFLEPLASDPEGAWTALARPSKKLRDGEIVTASDGTGFDGTGSDTTELTLRRALGAGRWEVTAAGSDLIAIMERLGRMPLPPYIRRAADDARAALDRERYQTVFATEPGAVAAPTAGLHLTDALLDALQRDGVEHATVTLHVGLGTFRPVETERLSDHPMHSERYRVPAETAAAIRATRARGGRVVAVGTTTVRTLEAAAAGSADGLPAAGSGSTDLFIQPGYAFRSVDALLTNFHLPRSTLICLVAAFADRDSVLAAYATAVRERYRFYSYGDAMFIA